MLIVIKMHRSVTSLHLVDGHTPTIKQYAGDQTVCGVDVDLNVQ